MNKVLKASLMVTSLMVVLGVGHYFMFSEKERKNIKNRIKDIIGNEDVICN